ncbi:TIGR02444 family protein [Cobetia sp. L2A1]|uniref:TIGR02444 family protein n=1 Tax=Cobetia sp. L2A1 TaxID=2686360 RepID=UPI00131ECF65|nr:TIGR02444 family protein [Cobetia sp. L2A1]
MGAHSTGLWDYALSLYAQPAPPDLPTTHSSRVASPCDVMSACLLLQDEAGLDVCELLWIHWLAAHGVVLTASPTRMLEGVRDWQSWMTGMLRERRQQLKQELVSADAAIDSAATQRLERLYQQLKACELSAEQEALAQLEALSPVLQNVTQRSSLRTPFASLEDPLLAFQHSLALLSGQTHLNEGDLPTARALRLLALTHVPAIKADAELVRGC